MEHPKVECGSFLILRTDGSEETIREKPTIKRIQETIGAEVMDTVNIGRATGSDLIMMLDDLGWEYEVVDKVSGAVVSPEEEIRAIGGHYEHRPTRPKKPANQKATELYHAICSPGTTHQIVGDVAIVRDSDF